MSLEKSIYHKKEKRKQYHDCRSFDRTCRNHGTCKWCERNRKHFDKKRRSATDQDLIDYEESEEN
jgi:hypothetical protein